MTCLGGICQRICGGGGDEVPVESDEELDLIRFFEKDCSLIRRQFPRSEIPKLAAAVTRRVIPVGECIVKQGEIMSELIFIFRGEASMERETDGEVFTPGKLIRGSHWGDGSLKKGAGSGATLRALATEGLQGLELACLSEEDFKRLGFEKLKYASKPALYARSEEASEKTYLGLGDVDFIVHAIEDNQGLRSHLEVCEEGLRRAARQAKLLTYKAGDIVARQNDFAKGAYIIRKGEAEIVIEEHIVRDAHASVWRVGYTNRVQQISTHQKELLKGQGSNPTLALGDVFGEISLFQGTRQLATLRMTTDAELYLLPRAVFRRCFKRKDPRKAEVDQLMNDCPVLSSFFKVQRHELASNHAGVLTFEPDQMIIKQGKMRIGCFWYVIATGSAILFDEKGSVPDAVLGRSDAFGLREIFSDCTPTLSVRAGPDGLTCAVFEPEIMKSMKESFAKDTLEAMEYKTIEEYRERKRLQSDDMGEHTSASSRMSMITFDPKRLENIGFLGRGAFGLVILQKEPRTGKFFALKRISKGLVVQRGCQKETSFEKDLTFLLSGSAFTVTLRCTWRDREFVYLLLDAELGSDLEKLLESEQGVFMRDKIPGSASLFYIACITEALGYIHDRFVVYRDLKPGNVMISARGYAKLGDFGLSRFALKPIRVVAGTPAYMAPEMLPSGEGGLSSGYSFEVDWFALGVVAFELLTGGHMPFVDESFKVSWSLLPSRLSSEANDFVRALLERHPASRLGAGGWASVEAHPWMAKVDFPKLRKHELPPPFVPPEFEVAVPAPQMWDERTNSPVCIPFTEHQGQKMDGEVWEIKQNIDDAMDRSRELAEISWLPEDRQKQPMGISVFTLAKNVEGDGEPITKCELRFWNPEKKTRPGYGWTTYRSHADLYAKYVNDGSGWDNNFEFNEGAVVPSMSFGQEEPPPPSPSKWFKPFS